MYFPYLRGKQFELDALLEVPARVYRKTIPIIEPINKPRSKQYAKLAAANIEFIFIVNPFHPVDNRMDNDRIIDLLNSQLNGYENLIYGFIIDQRFSINDLNAFLDEYEDFSKAIVFRFNPLAADLTAIRSAFRRKPVDYIIFDDKKVNRGTRDQFNTHPQRVLITDGFQRQDRNADYPTVSAFESNYRSYAADGWFGIGDYLSVGDYFKEGGGQVYVITLHITTRARGELIMNHFSSTIYADRQGMPAIKFAEANNLLIAAPNIIPLTTTGIEVFRDWQRRAHNPQLGAAKKASMMHHIEFMSGIV